MSFVEILQRALTNLPVLARFAIFMALIVIIPQLSRRMRLPAPVGLLLSGVLLGPHMLDVFPRQHPISEFFSELGMLLLMFFAAWRSTYRCFAKRYPGRLCSA